MSSRWRVVIVWRCFEFAMRPLYDTLRCVAAWPMRWFRSQEVESRFGFSASTVVWQ